AQSRPSFAIVLITAPDLRTARRLARAAVSRRLAACVNLVPRVESHYWWQGKVEFAGEVLLIAKTTRAKLTAFEQFVRKAHPYDTPEFVVLQIHSGSRRYLNWLAQSVRP